jgi:hypothetical protein
MTLAAMPADAQRVRGTLRDSITGAAVSGAVVTVTDSAGQFLARSIGDEHGAFAVMRLNGSAKIHVIRIGYRPRDISIAAAAADSSIAINLLAIPLRLASVEAVGRRVCPGQAGTEQALELWEQARAGLLASVVAREAEAPTVRVLSFSRSGGVLDWSIPADSVAARRTVRARNVIADRSYVAARPAWAFASDGYMQEERGGDRTFYAPDEAVLLDPTFADTHCLHVVNGKGAHAEDVGIAFEPVHDGGRDTLVDVTGVLWLTRVGPELKSMEFHYTGLEPEAKDSGGEVIFRLMPNGVPMIEEWSIRSALLVEDSPVVPNVIRRRPPDRPDRHDARLIGFHEVGGKLVSAEWPNGKRWHAKLREISGRVFSLDGEAVPGVRVWAQNTPDTATTDAEGRFTFPDMLSGLYLIRAADSSLAKVGVSRGATLASVLRGDDRVATIYFTSLADMMRSRCGTDRVPVGGTLLGRVVDVDGGAVPSARTVARWDLPAPDTVHTAASKAKARPDHTESAADTDGRFAVCGVPLDRSLHLRITSDVGNADVDVEWRGELMALTVVVRADQS